MKLAVDVYYFGENRAKAVGLLFEDWNDLEPVHIYVTYSDQIFDYEPGRFYKRELPCIIELLKSTKEYPIDTIVVDGYVFLDDQHKKGLGYYLYEYLEEKVSIIGVAKRPFINNNAIKVYRGKSMNPLYITSVGIDSVLAAENIKAMSGEYRIPMLLKRLDQETKLL